MKISIFKSKCPQCNSDEDVYIVDDGIIFLFRFFVGNNRLACGKCGITWREKQPDKKSEIKRRDNLF